MTDFKFTPEDFDNFRQCCDCLGNRHEIAKIANAKLKEWLDKAPTIERIAVDHWQERPSSVSEEYEVAKRSKFAKLVCIEKL